MLAAALLSVGHSCIFVVRAPYAKKRFGAAREQANGFGLFHCPDIRDPREVGQLSIRMGHCLYGD